MSVAINEAPDNPFPIPTNRQKKGRATSLLSPQHFIVENIIQTSKYSTCATRKGSDQIRLTRSLFPRRNRRRPEGLLVGGRGRGFEVLGVDSVVPLRGPD